MRYTIKREERGGGGQLLILPRCVSAQEETVRTSVVCNADKLYVSRGSLKSSEVAIDMKFFDGSCHSLTQKARKGPVL